MTGFLKRLIGSSVERRTGYYWAQVKQFLADQPSFAEVLKEQSSRQVPDGWKRFRSEQRRFELWHPPGWEEHLEGHLLVRPPLAHGTFGNPAGSWCILLP